MNTFFKKHKVAALLLGILLLGTFLRFYKLGEVSFVADEFLDINSSYAFFKTGQWQNWDFNTGEVNTENAFAPRDERAWLYKWQVAQLFGYLSPTEQTARLVSAFWGVLTIAFMYFAGWKWSGRKSVGLMSALLFAISISAIIFDRRLRMYAMFAPVFLLFSYFLYGFLEKTYTGKSKALKRLQNIIGVNMLYLLPAMLLGLLSLHLHQLSVMMILIVSVYAAVQALRKAKKADYFNKYVLVLIMLAAGYVAGLTLAPVKMAEFGAGLKFGEDHFSYISHVFGDYQSGLAAAILMAFGAWSLAAYAKKKDQAIWISLCFAVPLAAAIFMWRRNVGPQYIFFAQPFAMILLAAGIWALASFLRDNLPAKFKERSFAATFAIAFAVLPNWGYFLQENTVYKQTSSSENPNYRKVFSYVKKKRVAEDAVIMRNFRNYYLSGEDMPVRDFGGERSEGRLTTDQIKEFVSIHRSGWVVISENDESYIYGEALDYMEQTMQKISDPAVRGKVDVYRWGIADKK